METAEVSKGKRVKHAFPRKEVYHRFIHSDEYAYSPENGKQISCKGNYLFTGNIGAKTSIKDIEDIWEYYSSRMIAIINRDSKKVLINKTIADHSYYLERAIPSNYNIYYTSGTIPGKNILKDNIALLRLHSKFVIKMFIECRIKQHYEALNNKKKLVYNKVYENDSRYLFDYKSIVHFVKSYNLEESTFYDVCLNANYRLRFNNGNSIKINFPTLREIIDKEIFNEEQMLYLEQRLFYTKYCYGNGISFKDVQTNWNKTSSIKEISEYFSKKGLYHSQVLFESHNTWNTLVITAVEYNRNIQRNAIKKNIEESLANAEEAKTLFNKLNDEDYTVNDWRNRKQKSPKKVSYKHYTPPSNKNKRGKWTLKYIVGTNITAFKNIQLRLSTDGKYIETTLGAKVPLSAAINIYKMFMIRRYDSPHKTSWTTSDFGNIEVGIYNLRFITYKDKITDNKEPLGYKEWLIQIGCHAIWLDDFNDFVRYYHLEDKFGIQKEQKKTIN